MAKIECYNCKEVTEAVAPRYRCSFCNYPLYKYIQLSNLEEPEEKVIKNIKEADHNHFGDGNSSSVSDGEEGKSLLDTIKSSSVANSLLSRFGKKKEPELNETFIDKETTKTVEEVNLPEPPKTVLEPKPVPKEEDKTPSEAIFIENQNPEKSGKIVAGWLVVHTENKQALTYELFEGDNIIGRPDGPHHVDIEVENDKYVSRVHCIVRIEKDYLHRFSYKLIDNGKNRQGKPSTNGVYVNGLTRRIPNNSYVNLQDGDVVQVGETKMGFKNVTSAWSFESAAESVLQTDYTKTIAIKF